MVNNRTEYTFLPKIPSNNDLQNSRCDEEIDGKPYSEIVEEAREYIKGIGGFEKFAEWGLF